MNPLADLRQLETVDGTAILASLAVVSILGVVVALGVYIWYAIALSKLFPRLGAEGWKGWVPILNEATILSLGGKPAWNVVFYFIPILQLYGLYLKVVATHRINQRFGRGAGTTVLAVLLPPVWATLLAWGAPPYPEGDRLAGLRPGPLRQPADAGHPGAAQGYLAPPILPPGSAGAPAPVAPASFAPAPASFAPAPASFAPAPDSFAPHTAAAPAAPAAPAPPVVAPAASGSSGPLIDSVPWTSSREPSTASAPPPPAAAAQPAAAAPAAPAPEPAPVAPPAAPAPEPAPVAPPAAPILQPDFASADTVDALPASVRQPSADSMFAAPVPLPVPAEPAGAPVSAPQAPPEVPGADDDEFDATVVVSRRRGVRRVLVLDDGRSFALSATSIVIGRNPEGEPGEQCLSIPDKTRTLSKTHARLIVQGDEWRLTDLHSTNGVVVVADDGAETLLDPGESVIGAGRFILGEVGMHVAVESGS